MLNLIKLNFDEYRRLNLINDNIEIDDEVIAVLGDSIAMGWGVENDQTFSFLFTRVNRKKSY